MGAVDGGSCEAIMRREPLIRRVEHNCFRGWCVGTKRQGKRFVRYSSDKLNEAMLHFELPVLTATS